MGIKERGVSEKNISGLVYGIFEVSSAECQEPRGNREGYSKQNMMETKK
jgi:hypothetical protein